MVRQQPKVNNLQRPILIKQPTLVSPPKVDEDYFDKLAAFGLSCLAAAIVGKLIMVSLLRKE